MEKIEFYGIVFRSVSHMAWFEVSTSLFCMSMAWCVTKAALTAKKITYTYLWIVLATIHAGVSIDAFFATKGGSINGDMYSIDCIWFNAFLCFSYITLYRSLKKARV